MNVRSRGIIQEHSHGLKVERVGNIFGALIVVQIYKEERQRKYLIGEERNFLGVPILYPCI